MEIKLKTLTPIWTGGIETGRMDRLHETGIIGSLRWWYEAIVRGLGGSACDPTEHSCIYDPEKPNNGLCDVCQIFGATGWRRRFRLEIVADQTQPAWVPLDQMLNIRPPERTHGWYLPPGRMGTFTLRLTGEDQALACAANLLLFMEKWGSLGSKPQLGYGLFRIENREDVQKKAGQPNWQIFWENSNHLPDLRRFGFVEFQFRPPAVGWWTHVPGIRRVSQYVQPLVTQHGLVPIAPALKNEWRFKRWQSAWGEAREIFGTLHPERRRSRVAVSWAYAVSEDLWQARGWVWLPPANDKQTDTHLWSLLVEQMVWNEVLGVEGQLKSRRLTSSQDVLNLLKEAVK